MKRLLLPLLAALALPTAVEANLFQKEPTYEQIVSQCKIPYEINRFRSKNTN